MRSGSISYDEADAYVIHIDGEWSLEDLYVFPRTFEQVYFLFYSLLPDHLADDLERIQHSYAAFPWRGGYSAVSFYNNLKYLVPRRQRPQLLSINYSSPGIMELGLYVTVALSVGAIVKSIAGSIDIANTTYSNIMKGMQERKLLRLEENRRRLQFEKEEMEYIEKSAETMCRLLGFHSIKEINNRTGNPYLSLKILLSMFRRVRTLADYQRRGKADLPSDEDG